MTTIRTDDDDDMNTFGSTRTKNQQQQQQPAWKRLKHTTTTRTNPISTADAIDAMGTTATAVAAVLAPPILLSSSHNSTETNTNHTDSSVGKTDSSAANSCKKRTNGTMMSTTRTNSMNHTTHITILHQQHEIETLQMQLQYERDKNRLDCQKLQHTIEALQQKVQLVQTEATRQEQMVQQTQENCDVQIQHWVKLQETTLQHNQELQRKIEHYLYQQQEQQQQQSLLRSNANNNSTVKEEEQEYDESIHENDMLLTTDVQANQKLRQQIELYKVQTVQQREEIQQLQSLVQTKLQQLSQQQQEHQASNVTTESSYEEAPKTLLQELNGCRVQVAHAQRQIRQLERQVQVQQQRYTTLLTQQESGHVLQQRYTQVQNELQQLQTQYNHMKAEEYKYRTFIRAVQQIIQEESNQENNTNRSNRRNEDDENDESPQPIPEMSAIVRFLKRSQAHRTTNAVPTAPNCIDESPVVTTTTGTSTTTNDLADPKATPNQDSDTVWQQKYDLLQYEMTLYQREIESYKVLLQTYEQQMMAVNANKNKNTVTTYVSPDTLHQRASTTPTTMTNTIDVKSDVLRIEYQNIKELKEHLQTRYDDVVVELQSCQKTVTKIRAEYDALLTKYQKIQDAIKVERERRTNLQQELIEAEQLAGKGSFDPERTRILHMSETPLVQALKEEVTVLKRQLDTVLVQQQQRLMGSISSPDATTADSTSSPFMLSSTAAASSSSSTKSIPNAEKVIQRLKEQFKEQIGLFREGVYIMTGYKIDMITNPVDHSNSSSSSTEANTAKPTFRLRSVFAEQEEDQLLLTWPKMNSVGSGSNKSLDILQTDFAKYLSTTSSYDYISKLHSLPAFLASVQLTLFEKQTMMM
jgi:Mitotic checkpoint protein